MTKNHPSHGFTLVELLVVISMLAILTSFLIIFINPFKQIDKAKDAKRQSSLAQIASALDNYYNDHNCYPQTFTFNTSFNQGSTIYMKNVPQDPDCASGGSCFQYIVDPNSSCPQWNIIFSKVVNRPTNTIACAIEQIPGCVPVNYYTAGYNYCTVSGKADCPTLASLSIPLSGGSQNVPTPTPIPTNSPNTPTPTNVPTPTPGAPTATPTPTGPTPTPTPSGIVGLYGNGINTDTKANVRIGDTNSQKLSHRFRASATSTITSIRFSQRGGSGYSLGTGGTIRVAIYADDGTGKPSTTQIGTAGNITTGNPGAFTHFDVVTVSAPVTAGNLYHVVFSNIDANPSSNFISVNEIFVYGGTLSPREPKFSDSDYACLNSTNGGAWSVMGQYTAVMDVTYANGSHDGMGYTQNMISNYGVISGTSNMVREHFTVTGGNRSVSQVYARVRRTSGSDPLILSIKQGSTTLASVSVPASSIAQSTAGGDTGGSVWAGGAFSNNIILTNGTTYDLVLSTASTSQYTAAPIRKGSATDLTNGTGITYTSGFDSSLYFNDGTGQVTTNGSSWSDMYAFDNPNPDIQFYFQ